MYKYFIAIFVFVVSITAHSAPQQQSQYLSLNSDVKVINHDQVLLQTTLTLAASDKVYVQSDGNMWSDVGPVVGGISIFIDGSKVSNDAVVDWPSGHPGLQHSYNVIGTANLSAGTHVVQLIATQVTSPATFTVGYKSNLSIFVHPADQIQDTSFYIQSDPNHDYLVANQNGSSIDTSYWNYTNPTPLPFLEPLSLVVSPPSYTPVIVTSSSRAYPIAGQAGDVLLGIGLNHQNPGNRYSSWSVNDLGNQAENQAPVSNHAYFPNLSPSSTITLQATVFPWGDPSNPDKIVYKLGAGSKLITMYGGMKVTGYSNLSNVVNDPWDAVCIKTSNCSKQYLASSYFSIPQGHSGVVMFSAKTRVQEQIWTGTAGGAAIQIGIWDDAGNKVGEGSIGAQYITADNSISQRTLTSSYLAAGEKSLKPGGYLAKVEVLLYGMPVQNPLNNLYFRSDLPLIWFD